MKSTVALVDWDEDIHDIAHKIVAAGFERVVLCVEDRHVLYREDAVIDAVHLLKRHRLEVHLDPWGVQGFPTDAISHPTAFYAWLRLAVKAEADALMLDEPTHHVRLGVEEIFAAVQQYTPDARIHMAVEPNYLTRELRERVDEVSLSAYFFGRQISRATPTSLEIQVSEWYDDLHECFDSAWIQLFDIPAGKEWVPSALVQLWHARGVPVNVWAWNAQGAAYEDRCDNPDLVWKHTLSSLEIIRRS